MRLYNTATRQIEEVKPLDAPQVSVYTCGPTVYDYPHIGNWFTFIRYDLLIRALKTSGLAPKWVMNITDVGHLVSDADEGEDKLEKGARREGKTAWDVAKFYGDYFTQALQRVGIPHPDHLPKATDHINSQINLIKTLETKGFTYLIDDGVYFDTSKFADYGKLANLDLEHLKAGARVEANPQKRNATDFALWKLSPKDSQRDMEWDSPWGTGFPGWHLECSAMAMEYLGETLDIHGGGIDHIPVHHSNEVAQSEAATGKPFVQHWYHANFILVEGKKMSKSLNNFFTLEDVESKGFSLDAFRLLVLESHYRTEANFSWTNLEAAQNRLHGYRSMADHYWQPRETGVEPHELEQTKRQLMAALADDLNTPQVLSILSELQTRLDNRGLAVASQSAFKSLLDWVSGALGIDLLRNDLEPAQKQLLKERQYARDIKDWTKSDSIRDQLEEQGISIRDTDYGQIWSRT